MFLCEFVCIINLETQDNEVNCWIQQNKINWNTVIFFFFIIFCTTQRNGFFFVLFLIVLDNFIRMDSSSSACKGVKHLSYYVILCGCSYLCSLLQFPCALFINAKEILTENKLIWLSIKSFEFLWILCTWTFHSLSF